MSNPKINIKNTLSIEVEIFDVYNKSGKKDDSYTYTSLGKIASGQSNSIQTIHAASQLQAMCNGKIDGLSQQQENFPVAVIQISVFSKSTDFTLTTTDLSAMVNTFNFVRYASANPSSKLAQQFISALGEKDQDKAVNQFFAQTKNFSDCTMTTWAAITDWQTQHLSPWQGSFYLYDASENIKKITLIAGVNITLGGGKASGELCMADANGEWSSASDRVNIDMNGGSIAEVNQGEGNISVSLEPFWMNIAQKKEGKLKYLIGPALTGTVNGIKVMGNFQQITMPGEKKKDGSVLSDVGTWLKKQAASLNILSVIGLFISYKMWKAMEKSEKDEVVNKSENPTEEKEKIEVEQERVGDNIASQRDAEMPSEVAKVKAQVENLPKIEEEIRSSEQKLSVQETLNEQKEQLSDILEEAPPSDQVEMIAENIEAAQTDLDNGNPDAALEKLSDTGNQLDTLVSSNEDAFTESQKEASKRVQEAIEEAKAESQEIDQAEKEKQERDDQDSDDDVDSDDFDSVDSEPFEFGVE